LASSVNQAQSFNYNLVYSALPAAQDTNLKNAYTLIAHPSDANKMFFIGPIPDGSDVDIKASNSTNGGQTWSPPIRVNNDAIGNGKQQDMVWAAYNQQGAIAAVWRDRRNDSGAGFWNVGYDFYYAISNDNGATFGVNQLMSNQFIPFDSILAGDGNDFLSAVYSGDTLYTVWGDTRSGRLNIWFSKTIASSNSTVEVNVLNDSDEHFTVQPNPANNLLHINFKEESMYKQVEIFNLSGDKVYGVKATQAQHTIDVSAWAAGLYFLRIDGFVQRIVVD
jgi:hypothetical protein